MKDENRYSDNPVQDLLHAVVVRAADDYREANVKMIMKPSNYNARKTAKECRAFFLSPEFSAYTTVEGAFILEKLDQELEAFKAEYKEYLDLEAKMLQEAREAARLFMQKDACEERAQVLRCLLSSQMEKVTTLIYTLRDQQSEMPSYARKQLQVPTLENVMLKARTDLMEDSRNGKDGL